MVAGLKNLGSVGTHIFLNYLYLEKFNFMHFERHSPFKMHNIIYIFQKPEKDSRVYQ